MSPGRGGTTDDEDNIRPKCAEKTGNEKLERRMEKLGGRLKSCMEKGGWKDRNMEDQNGKIREQNGKAGEQVGNFGQQHRKGRKKKSEQDEGLRAVRKNWEPGRKS